jgi:hypothetical protein
MLESVFQSKLIKEIGERFPGSIVTKVESYIQGLPDLLILYEDKWAMLECKRNRNAKHQPNQDDYVKKLDGMSFSRFIYPENKEEVLNDLQQTFGARREACSS